MSRLARTRPRPQSWVEKARVRDVARALLRQNTMALPTLSTADRRQVLRFVASFLWADLEVAEAERRFFAELARELDVGAPAHEIARLLERPPCPEEIDPTDVPLAAADTVRRAALRAIAADGHVSDDEMAMFELLDDLLPRPDGPLPAA